MLELIIAGIIGLFSLIMVPLLVFIAACIVLSFIFEFAAGIIEILLVFPILVLCIIFI